MAATKSSLLDEIKGAPKPPRSTCQLFYITEALPPEERKDLIAALKDRTIDGESIARVLRKRGFTIQGQAIQRCRRGVCGYHRKVLA